MKQQVREVMRPLYVTSRILVDTVYDLLRCGRYLAFIPSLVKRSVPGLPVTYLRTRFGPNLRFFKKGVTPGTFFRLSFFFLRVF